MTPFIAKAFTTIVFIAIAIVLLVHIRKTRAKETKSD